MTWILFLLFIFYGICCKLTVKKSVSLCWFCGCVWTDVWHFFIELHCFAEGRMLRVSAGIGMEPVTFLIQDRHVFLLGHAAQVITSQTNRQRVAMITSSRDVLSLWHQGHIAIVTIIKDWISSSALIRPLIKNTSRCVSVRLVLLQTLLAAFVGFQHDLRPDINHAEEKCFECKIPASDPEHFSTTTRLNIPGKHRCDSRLGEC